MTRGDLRRVIVAYDIPDDRRRTRVAKALLSYGDRVQYSVFVVDASPAKLQRMRFAVESLIKPDQDSVLVCDLGPLSTAVTHRFEYLGVRRPITDLDDFIL